MLKIYRIAISRRIAKRYFATPIFEDGSAGEAKAFDTEADAIGYANQQYPGVRVSRSRGRNLSSPNRSPLGNTAEPDEKLK
ncbi:hypothetical protein [Cupriavidus necator]